MAQVTYPDSPALGQPGQLADNGPNDIVSVVSAVDIPMGRFVVDAGLAADGLTRLVTLPSADAATQKLFGVVVHSHAIESDPAQTYPVIKAGKAINILRKGRIFVSVEQAFDPSVDTAFVRFTANGAANQPGMLRKDADTARADELDGSGYLVRHLILSKVTAAGVIPVEINLPS